jgi:hypothetical protein
MIKDSDLKNWNKSKDGLPEEGVLCIVYFPIGIYQIQDDGDLDMTTGPITLAYYRNTEGWIYADTPRKLNWDPIFLEAAYWKPFESL